MKRFTATEKWDKEWFMDLSCKHKVLWQFICDACDCAGVWEPNWKLASVQIGERVKPEDLKVFGERVMMLASGKVLLVGFVAFQYGKLSTDCRPHQGIFRAVEKHGVGAFIEGHPDFKQRVSDESEYPIHRVSDTLQEKDKDKDKETVQEKDSDAGGRVTAETIYEAYPRKVSKPEAIKAIKKALTSPPLGMDAATWPQDLLAITERYAALRKGEDQQFTPHPSTWFNGQRYNDDPSTWKSESLAPNGNHRPTHRPAAIVTRNTAPLPDDRPDLNATSWRPTERVPDAPRSDA